MDIPIRVGRSAAKHPAGYESMQRDTGTDPKQRKNIQRGAAVSIVQKQDQASGKLTEGVVRDILTNSASHPHGIKVRLTDGKVGRVKEIVTSVGQE